MTKPWRPKGTLSRAAFDEQIREARGRYNMERDQVVKGLWWLRMEGLMELQARIPPFARKKAK